MKKAFKKTLVDLVTTARDSLAKVVLSQIGIDVPVIPCSSIFAIDQYNLKDQGEEYVVLHLAAGLHSGRHPVCRLSGRCQLRSTNRAQAEN